MGESRHAGVAVRAAESAIRSIRFAVGEIVGRPVMAIVRRVVAVHPWLRTASRTVSHGASAGTTTRASTGTSGPGTSAPSAAPAAAPTAPAAAQSSEWWSPGAVGDGIGSIGKPPFLVRSHRPSPFLDDMQMVRAASRLDRTPRVPVAALRVIGTSIHVDRTDRRILVHPLLGLGVVGVVGRLGDPVGGPRPIGRQREQQRAGRCEKSPAIFQWAESEPEWSEVWHAMSELQAAFRFWRNRRIGSYFASLAAATGLRTINSCVSGS